MKPKIKPNPPRGWDGKVRVFKSAGDSQVSWKKTDAPKSTAKKEPLL